MGAATAIGLKILPVGGVSLARHKQGIATGMFRLRAASNLKFIYFLACLALRFAACEGGWGDAIDSRQPLTFTGIEPAASATAMRPHTCFVSSFSIQRGVSVSGQGCFGQRAPAVKSSMQCPPRNILNLGAVSVPGSGSRLFQLRRRDSRLPVQSRPSSTHSGGARGGAKHPQQPSRARSRSIQLNKSISDCTRIPALCELILENVGDFNNVNVATAFTKLAKLHLQSKATLKQAEAPALVQLTARAALRMNDFKSQEVANTLCALATMGLEVEEGKLIQALTARASRIVSDFNALEVDNTLWALKKMGLETEGKLVDELTARARAIKQDAGSQNAA